MTNWNLDARQRHTLDYFQEHAHQWRSRAEADGVRRVSTIRQRNDHALDLVDSQPGRFASALDLGCGTGELVLELARRGVRSAGIDFSDKMIDLCRDKATRLGFADGCTFRVGSVIDYDFTGEHYDLVTAFGFIEYLRPDQLARFFALCRELVGDTGVAQIGSRNRLFNLVSMNQFTAAELRAGTTGELLAEAIALTEAESLDGFLEWAGHGGRDRDVLNEYPQTDVDVAGYQYTPATICQLLAEADLRPIAVSPVHYHGFPPVITRAHPEMHAEVSNLVHERFRDRYRFVPYSSSYIITAGARAE